VCSYVEVVLVVVLLNVRRTRVAVDELPFLALA
jgi:hypothetical protein